jgi:hypothetical protein
MNDLTPTRAALARLQPQPGADHHVWAARITACWRASVEAILEVGRLLIAAKEALPHGQFGPMIKSELPFTESTAQRLMTIAADQRLSNPAHVQHLPPSWGTLYELTKLPDDEFEAKISDGTIRPDMMRRDLAPPKAEAPGPALQPTPLPRAAARPAPTPAPATEESQPETPAEPGVPAPLPSGARSIMSSRQEPDDSLDYFPTPPWATRALFEHVFRHLKVKVRSAWDPACGEGHMAEPMREYVAGPVHASDVFDYGYGDVLDYLATPWRLPEGTAGVRWIVTNPPFSQKTEDFFQRAICEAGEGVALFVRLQWLETKGRYERVFRTTPPTLIAFFSERVPLCKGRWNPEGDTATAYIWLVWIKGRAPQAPFWIPPDCRDTCSRPGDEERYTATPVVRALKPLRIADDGSPINPSTGEILDTDHPGDVTEKVAEAASQPNPNSPPICQPIEDIPAFLHRDEQNRAPFMEVSQP